MSTILFKLCAILIFNIIQICYVQSAYVLSDEKVTFFEGFVRCKQYNMDPLEIQSQQEERELEAVLPSIAPGWEYGYWLFATNLGNKQTYYWLNSGRPLLFTKWNEFEPNGVNGSENCLEILNVGGTKNFKWNDISCDSKVKFICQTRRSCQYPNGGDINLV